MYRAIMQVCGICLAKAVMPGRMLLSSFAWRGALGVDMYRAIMQVCVCHYLDLLIRKVPKSGIKVMRCIGSGHVPSHHAGALLC